MKQKLGLCASLIHDPDFLLLDEPTTGVDPLSRRQVWDLIDAIRANRPQMSVLVSTAYMEEAARLGHLVAMEGGPVRATGSPADLMERTGKPTVEAAYVALLARNGADSTAPDQPVAKAVLKPEPRAIRAEGLTKRFGDFTAVNAVSFKIARGEIFGFLGSNGCGKTTTVKMLTGLTPATEGEAWIFGQPRFSLQRLLSFTAREAMQVRRDPVRLLFSFVGSALLLLIMSFGISQEVRDIPFAAFDLDRSPESRAYLSGFEDTAWFLQAPPISNIDELERRMASGELALALQIPPGFGTSVRRGEAPKIAGLIDGSDTNRAGTVESYIKCAHAHVLSTGAQSALALTVLATPRAPDTAPPAQLMPRFHYNPAMESLPAIGPTIPPLLLLLFPAVFAAAILSVMPTLQFSGMITPVSSLESAARIMGKFWPTTWYMGLSVGTFTKGLGLSELSGHLLRLAAFGPVLTLLSVLALRKQAR